MTDPNEALTLLRRCIADDLASQSAEKVLRDVEVSINGPMGRPLRAAVTAYGTSTPGLIVHRDREHKNWWCVTHLRSGLMVLPLLFPKMTAARAAANEIGELANFTAPVNALTIGTANSDMTRGNLRAAMEMVFERHGGVTKTSLR